MPTRTSPVVDPMLAEVWRKVASQFLDVRVRWVEVAEQLGLSAAGLDALLKADPEQPPSMSQLAEQLGCDASYVTAMVDDLEAAGYAQRHPSGRDRRVKKVALTSAGVDAREFAHERLTAPPPALRTLPRTRQRALADLLRQAVDGTS